MAAGDRRHEIARLVEAHYASLYRYAFRLAGRAPDADDLTQQAFLVAQEKFDQLRSAENARAWLFAIVRNAFLKSRRNRVSLRTASLESLEEPAETVDSAPDLTGEDLSEILTDMPDEQRIPLVLFYFEELSYRDIAATLDLPIGTVMSRLSRAKSSLRKRISERTTLTP